jgi:AcrR family transcriptional regulator
MPSTSDRILDSAEHLFAEKGYQATTLRDIASDVGIQNPSLYKHFASKADIYEAVLDRAVRPILDELWDTEDEIANVVALLASRPTVCRLILREMLSSGSPLTAIVVDRFTEVIDQTRSYVQERSGRAPPRREIALRVLAMSHMMIGMGASVDFHRELTSHDLSAKASLRMQEDIIASVSRALFAEDSS